MTTAVGIDAIEFQSGSLKLDLANTFAPAQGEDPDKYTKGLGLNASAFPDSYEDIVTMGANAALRLMERRNLTPNDIGRIDVATESSFDNAKPISTYIAGCLEQRFDENLHHANKGERKFACIAGTQAVDDACNWIQSGRNREKSALVIATDTALYTRGDPGEATQGAGAVALLISANPDIVALSHYSGIGSADETDFLKPNQQFPTVDGKRSMQVYLARMREALEDYESVAGDLHPDDFAYIPFHTPFPGMVRKAGLLGYRHLIRGTDIEEYISEEIGYQPLREDYDADEHYHEALRAYMDDLKQTSAYQNAHDTQIEPTVRISRDVGNWYTGSVHVARISALLDAYESNRELTGDTLLVGSYGSGAQAEIHTETIQNGWQEEIAALDITDQLDNRYSLSFSEYEDIHDAHNHSMETDLKPFTTPSSEFIFDGWGRMGERQYRYVE